jgi:hypothetical protein
MFHIYIYSQVYLEIQIQIPMCWKKWTNAKWLNFKEVGKKMWSLGNALEGWNALEGGMEP